jgi:protoheme ferro-lyase
MYNEANSRSEHMKEFTNKVAEKLGVPSDKVAMAMQSVRKEWMDQMIMEKLGEAVKNGVITQAEAKQIQEWLKNRPEGVQKLMAQMSGHMGGMMGMGKGMGMGMNM